MFTTMTMNKVITFNQNTVHYLFVYYFRYFPKLHTKCILNAVSCFVNNI